MVYLRSTIKVFAETGSVLGCGPERRLDSVDSDDLIPENIGAFEL